MERLLLLFFVFIGSFGFSQKQYHFDYAMLYDNVVKLNDTMSSNLHLVNSKDNSYGLFVSYNKDSTRVNLYFIQYDYTVAKFNLNKDLFFKAETINLDCNTARRYSNPYKYQTENYDFAIYNDTLINDTLYNHYAIKSLKDIKYQKKKKIITSHFITDKNSPDFNPFFYHTTIYNEWLENKGKIPNGVIKILYNINVKGEMTFKQQLNKLIKIDKYITIPEECDFTKSPK